MIDADYAAINYVSGSHQLDRVLHKVVTFTVSARTETGVRLCLRVKCVRRKLCVQRLVSVRSIYRTGLVSMSTLAESPTGLREAPRANSSRAVAPPRGRSYGVRYSCVIGDSYTLQYTLQP